MSLARPGGVSFRQVSGHVVLEGLVRASAQTFIRSFGLFGKLRLHGACTGIGPQVE